MAQRKTPARRRAAARPATNERKTDRGKYTAKRIRKRTDNAGDTYRHRKVTIRCSRRVSNELASIQGLMTAFGKKETLADVFEFVILPRVRTYVRPYARKAARARALAKAAKEGGAR